MKTTQKKEGEFNTSTQEELNNSDGVIQVKAPQINGVEYDNKTTVSEFVEMQIKKGEFDRTAKGFNTVITAEDLRPSAQDLINEVGLNPLSPISYFKNTKPIDESDYCQQVNNILGQSSRVRKNSNRRARPNNSVMPVSVKRWRG